MSRSQPELEIPVPFENKEPQIASFPIVGIGASAGGLEAFTQLLEALPANTGMAFVLVQHLDPAHKSELANILSKVTSMKVGEVTDGMRVEPNQVYVIPPNTLLNFAGRAFHVALRPASSAPVMTIDYFLESLATEQSRLSLGVVLSGTGADGSEGLKAIKSACGITFAQDEQSSKYPAMPRSAVHTGIVDFVLAPAQIAAELARIGLNPFVIPPSEQPEQEVLPQGDGEMKEVFSLLLRATGVDFTHYKEPTMRRRIGRRMIVHRFEYLGEYVSFMRHHPEEVKELFRDALINVTSFFRDPDAYLALAKQIADLIQRNELERSFRAWIPGCSTGEELYSLAICVYEVFEAAGLRPEFQFFGTDISEGALSVARAGFYPDRILAEISEERLSRYFTKIDGRFQINKVIREMCIFARHDLTRDTPFSHLNLVSCRNVLIYLDSVLQKALFPSFHYALDPAGLLFLGSAESVGSSADIFSTVDSKYKIFSRTPVTVKKIPQSWRQTKVSDNFTQLQVATAVGTHHLGNKVDRAIRDRYTPDAVVINRNWQILQFRGQTGFYLEPAAGDASFQLLRMARGDLPYVLREVVSNAMDRNTFVQKTGVRVEQGGEVRDISLEITPLEIDSSSEPSFLVVFNRTATQIVESSSVKTAKQQPFNGDERVVHLERELKELRHYQKATAEEHDAAMEELRALNEELGSANEELQSSNEELGTTKEELQSSNEELTTVNEELDTRNRQLRVLNDDLNNLFTSVNSPVLKVDRDLRLQRFSPASEKLGIATTDLTHPIRDLQHLFGTLGDIELLISDVIEKLTITNHDFQDKENCWWTLSIRPYRTGDHRIDGAVLTFSDIDAIQRALHISEAARQYTDAVLETVWEPLVILTHDLKIERANANFYQTFTLAPAQAEGRLFLELDNRRWDTPGLRSRLEEVALTNSSFTRLEVTYNDPTAGTRIFILNARQIRPSPDSDSSVLLAFEDITDRRDIEDENAQQLLETGQQLDRTKEELRALAVDLMNAQEEEARRIARELHDDFSQRLAFLEITIEKRRLSAVRKDPEIDSTLETLRKHISQLADDIRGLSHRMHPSSLEHLNLEQAMSDLSKEAASVRTAPVYFTGDNLHSAVPLIVKSAIYRITQEALRNSTKYAPGVPVTIVLTEEGKSLNLVISDAGPGFNLLDVRGKTGLGIISMQERARSIGSTFEVHSAPGKGVTITLNCPLPDENL